MCANAPSTYLSYSLINVDSIVETIEISQQRFYSPCNGNHSGTLKGKEKHGTERSVQAKQPSQALAIGSLALASSPIQTEVGRKLKP